MDKNILFKTRRNLIFLFIVFLAFLFSARFVWFDYLNPSGLPEAREGRLDLSQALLDEFGLFQLNGEWAFYPGLLLSPNQIDQTSGLDPTYVSVPGFLDTSDMDKAGLHYGTYHLQVNLTSLDPDYWKFRLSKIRSAYRLYVDGVLVSELGGFEEGQAHYSIGHIPIYPTVHSHSGQMDLVLQISHDSDQRKEIGIAKPLLFGSVEAIDNYRLRALAMQLVPAFLFFFYSIYVLILYVIGIRQQSMIYFAVLTFLSAVTILMDNEGIFFALFDVPSVFANQLIYFFYLAASLLMVVFARSLFPIYQASFFLRTYIWAASLYLFFILLAPAALWNKTYFFVIIFFFCSPLISFIMMGGVSWRQIYGGTIFLLFTATAILNSTIWGIIDSYVPKMMEYYPFDMVIAIVSMSAFWFKGYYQTTMDKEELTIRLQAEIDQKDNFLANTSHELRNPLHGILNIAQVIRIQCQGKLSLEDDQNLHLLQSIGDHMSFMLDDLLDLTRIKENMLILNTVPLAVGPLVLSVCDMLRFTLIHRKLELDVEIAEDLPLVWADENRLMQIVFNLIHNAIKYTPEGRVRVSVYEEDGRLILDVVDTGIGISEDMLDRIFKPYERDDSSMTAIAGGLGVGLAISQELANLHSGSIQVKSHLGQGSTFSLSLPILADGEELQTKDGQPQTIALEGSDFVGTFADLSFESDDYKNGLRSGVGPGPDTEKKSILQSNQHHILIVDDDPVNLQVISKILRTDNYLVSTATSGPEALELLRSGKYDLLISDIMMPQMSGYELASIVRQNYDLSELPILFLTARSRRDDLLMAFHSGANDYVRKPVDATELRARVRALVYLKQTIEERLRIEAAWLQAQIKPHFFFNILNSIIILSEIDLDKMRDLAETFSLYLQKSFDFTNTDMTVPIANEIDLVESYLSIEKIRFGDRLQVIWQLDDGLDFSLPPLVLQTLVENAIKHGLWPKPEGGTVTIIAQDQGDHYYLAVVDNGVGYDQKLKESTSKNKDRVSGVGIPNTNLRLNALYGQGLTVTSQPGQGTTVSFNLPK